MGSEDRKIQKGFTTIELIIIIVVIGILVAVAIPRYANLRRNASDGVARGVLGALRAQNSLMFSERIIGRITVSYTMRIIANNMRELKGFSWTAGVTRFTMTIAGNTYAFTLTPIPYAPRTPGTITAGGGTFSRW